MYPPIILHPRAWAERNFGTARLGDRRRTRRLVALAAPMMRCPNASLPQQLQSPKALKAAYRLLEEPDVTPQAVIQPHCQQTRRLAGTHAVVLFVQDTTQADFTVHRRTQGLGPIGDGKGRGFLLQTVLAVLPSPRQVLGIAHQEPFLRKPAPHPKENSSQRQRRPRESQVWERAVLAVGPPPPDVLWVHTGDRGADLFDFLSACRRQEGHFLVRAYQERCVVTPEATASYLLTFAATLPAQGERTVAIPARPGQPGRDARLAIRWSPITLQAPAQPRGTGRAPLSAWVVRVVEVEPPAGVEPLEWVLLTSVPTLTLAAAWERVDWYRCRWLIEEYHHCLKSGCLLEQRQLRNYAGLTRLLALLAPIAVRLLQLREIARQAPEQLATEALPREVVQLVATLAELPVETLTVGRFWRAVASYGGYLGRRRDGPPGWQTLWRGWLHVQTLLEGVRLAPLLPPSKCG
jgi:Transposase DNA-binding/Transposase DDE domain